METWVQIIFVVFFLSLFVGLIIYLYVKTLGDLKRSFHDRLEDKDKIIQRLEIIISQRDEVQEQLLRRITDVVQESTKMVKHVYDLLRIDISQKNNP